MNPKKWALQEMPDAGMMDRIIAAPYTAATTSVIAAEDKRRSKTVRRSRYPNRPKTMPLAPMCCVFPAPNAHVPAPAMIRHVSTTNTKLEDAAQQDQTAEDEKWDGVCDEVLKLPWIHGAAGMASRPVRVRGTIPCPSTEPAPGTRTSSTWITHMAPTTVPRVPARICRVSGTLVIVCRSRWSHAFSPAKGARFAPKQPRWRALRACFPGHADSPANEANSLASEAILLRSEVSSLPIEASLLRASTGLLRDLSELA